MGIHFSKLVSKLFQVVIWLVYEGVDFTKGRGLKSQIISY
ncbi:hypothetical protein MNBD_GAMMA11-3053 [hydrothermal vent metagenome]|uniref:Uncharacterized protein n=1 Tax=hydrothermal vent metagenome TaxID=652676 RepID=A0A3B0X3Q5_9ZZZZ